MVILLVVTGGFLPGQDGGLRDWSTYGQSSTATLSGTVLDEAGGVIPDVKLTLLNLSTALQRHATTDETGSSSCHYFRRPLQHNVAARRIHFGGNRNVGLNTGAQLALRIKAQSRGDRRIRHHR